MASSSLTLLRLACCVPIHVFWMPMFQWLWLMPDNFVWPSSCDSSHSYWMGPDLSILSHAWSTECDWLELESYFPGLAHWCHIQANGAVSARFFLHCPRHWQFYGEIYCGGDGDIFLYNSRDAFFFQQTLPENMPRQLITGRPRVTARMETAFTLRTDTEMLWVSYLCQWLFKSASYTLFSNGTLEQQKWP